MRQRLLALATVLLFAFACRDGVGPFTPPIDPEAPGALVRLTWGAGDERDPQWSEDGTSIYYHTDVWVDAPALRNALLRIPATGGTATLLAPAAQPDPFFRLLLPVPSPDGEEIAYLQLVRERTDRVCSGIAGLCPPAPLLDTAVVRVRSLEATGSVLNDAGAGVRYPGATRAVEPPFAEEVYPFHLDYLQDNHLSNLRPSWSPDGTRLVLSDGTQLLLWRPGEAAATPIPNTTDGVAPQWSPDGQWIAFGIIERGASQTTVCNCAPGSTTPILVERTGWTVAARRIARIRADGTGLEVLTEGSEPAWSPTGDALFFRRGEEGLFRVALAAPTAVQPLAGTQGARAPAVSPDGRVLVFSRRLDPTRDFDLWRLQLTP